jgi:hypothetical protein
VPGTGPGPAEIVQGAVQRNEFGLTFENQAIHSS